MTMVVINSHRLQYRAHNGRRFNIKVTYNPNDDTFKLSRPENGVEWRRGDMYGLRDRSKKDLQVSANVIMTVSSLERTRNSAEL